MIKNSSLKSYLAWYCMGVMEGEKVDDNALLEECDCCCIFDILGISKEELVSIWDCAVEIEDTEIYDMSGAHEVNIKGANFAYVLSAMDEAFCSEEDSIM